jgi:hypothetical protein
MVAMGSSPPYAVRFLLVVNAGLKFPKSAD